jgi:hypothetical protein
MTFKLLTRAYFVLLAGVLALGIIQPGAVMAEIAVESEIEFELESFMDISGDYTISSVSVSGDYAVAGNKVFKKEEDAWKYQATLADVSVSSVAISGDYVIAGDYKTAYIFKRDGDTWNQQATLLPEDTADNSFGYAAVSISGDYAIVGDSANEENGKNSPLMTYQQENVSAHLSQSPAIMPLLGRSEMMIREKIPVRLIFSSVPEILGFSRRNS